MPSWKFTMKTKDYFKELSLTILGVLIALLIDNYREDVRDDRIIKSYLDIVAEDLNFDIINLTTQMKQDSAYAKKLKVLSDVLTTNADLPPMHYSLASWTTQDVAPYRKLSAWDSLDYYTLQLYENNEYKIRKIGFSTIVNSNLNHRIDQMLLKKITIYYTTDSDRMDFVIGIDDTCQWNAIPFLNKYQGAFRDHILTRDFDITLLRNEASGRYGTTLREIYAKQRMKEQAVELLASVKAYLN